MMLVADLSDALRYAPIGQMQQSLFGEVAAEVLRNAPISSGLESPGS